MNKVRKIKAPAAERSLNALLVINSSSKSSAKAKEMVIPYLDHLGIPYDVLDLGKKDPVAGLERHPLIIIGHASVCTRATQKSEFLDALRTAVDAGTGMVSFDTGIARGCREGGPTVDDAVTETLSFNGNGHFITQRHGQGSTLRLVSKLKLAPMIREGVHGLVNGAHGNPLVAVSSQGTGRVVQWTSSDWMHTSVLGPLGGLDDVFWRSLVWAARKPFVMRGLPPIVTMRVDDVAGRGTLWGRTALYWIENANRYGFKPWLGLFIYNLDPKAIKELRTHLQAGNVTAFPRAFGRPPRTPDSTFWYNPKALPFRSETYDEFIFFDHTAGKPWSKAEAEKGLKAVDDWYAENPDLPISSYAVPHWYEAGANVIDHIAGKWGCQFTGLTKDVDLPYAAKSPWLKSGPFRLHEEPGPVNTTRPTCYADFAEFAGHTFFNCLTEIRDDAGYEWAPDNDVPATVGRGVRQLKRAMDSMAMACLFTRETDCIYKIKPQNWEQALSGIADGIREYNPRFMTIEDTIKIVRATKTSSLESAVHDTKTGVIKVELSGTADVETGMYVFTDDTGDIKTRLVDLPRFETSASIEVDLKG